LADTVLPDKLPTVLGAADMADNQPAVLAFFHNIVAGRETEFEEWFQHEHLPERIAIPGFLVGRRYEAASIDRSYFHFYLIRSVEDLKSDAYIARVNEPTSLTRIVMSEITKNVFRTVCRRTFRFGAMRGAAAVTVRLADNSTEAKLKARIEELARDKAVACGEIWQAVDPLDFSASAEERLRGGDRKIETCLLLETLRLPEAEKIALALADDFRGANIGIYRFLCDISISEQPSY
jgi:hypothetical protein